MRRSLVLLVVAGCAGADAATTTPHVPAARAEVIAGELGLHPGETMAFECELAGVLVGEAQLAVGELGELGGRPAIVVKSRAATAGAAALVRKIVDEATTIIDAGTGQPLAVDSNVEIGGKRTVANAKFGPAAVEVTFQRDGAARQGFRVPNGGQRLHDAHSAMAQLRGWKGAPGELRTVYVIGGRRLWRIDVTYVGEQTVGSAAGNRRAVVYDGVSYRARRDLAPESNKPARRFRVWLSDDGDRVPLKVTAATELGDIVLTLNDYARP
jgi:Protein of unknown function (DUF3108)